MPDNGYEQQNGFPQRGGYPQPGGYGQQVPQGFQQQAFQVEQPQSDYSVMAPQPDYGNGMPQPIRQPMRGSGTAAGFAGSKAFRSGLGSVLWLLFGWLLFGIGPIVAFFKGISAIFRGITELIRASFTGGFGRAAAIVGIILGLLGSGISGTGFFIAGRTVYLAYQADLNGEEIVLEDDQDARDLFLRGKPHTVPIGTSYGDYDEEEAQRLLEELDEQFGDYDESDETDDWESGEEDTDEDGSADESGSDDADA